MVYGALDFDLMPSRGTKLFLIYQDVTDNMLLDDEFQNIGEENGNFVLYFNYFLMTVTLLISQWVEQMAVDKTNVSFEDGEF